MKASIFKLEWTLLSKLIFSLGFIALALLSYFIYKRGALCSALEDEEYQAATRTSQLIQQLLSLWTRLVLFFNTSKISSVEMNRDKEQSVSNMCLNSYITTDALIIIFATHLPKDINMVLRVCHGYIAELFTKPKPETLLFMTVALIFFVNVFFLLMFICVRKIQQCRHSPYKYKALCSRCNEEEEPLIQRAPSFENRTALHAQLCKPQSFCSLKWILNSLMLAFSLSLVWEYIRLYQSKVAERASTIVKGMPAGCDPHSMSILDSVKEFLRHHFSWTHGLNACDDYYYALLVDPLWEVSPLMVCSSVFSHCLLYPLELTCSSLGRGIRFFFLEIPSQWQPVILVVVFLLGLLVLLMLCSYRLHVPLLFKLEPVTPNRTNPLTRRKKNCLRDRYNVAET